MGLFTVPCCEFALDTGLWILNLFMLANGSLHLCASPEIVLGEGVELIHDLVLEDFEEIRGSVLVVHVILHWGFSSYSHTSQKQSRYFLGK